MRFAFIFLILFYCAFSDAQVYKDRNASVEDRIASLLSFMTLDEKISYIGGVDGFYIRDIPRLGLPKIKMSDGPVGVRTWGQTTAYPAGICNSSTWNKDLVFSLGQALGKDARARGVHILLGPGVNIYGAPMCGRNFEYFGEDPYLSGKMAAQFIKGVQSQKVVATVKHFAGNNQEWDRYDVSSDIDERTLQEIYLPAFRAAVKEGGAGAVMNAYNLLNGVHCTQNNHLNNEILKGQWQFTGILMSDWGSTHDGVAAALGGLDLEMPAGDNMNYSNLSSALLQGNITQATIDDKVRRILRIIFSFGFYDNVQTDATIPLDNPDNDTVSLRLAREGIVLLKNDSILPFSISSLKSLAVVGPNSDKYIAGGGSSYTDPFHYISIYKGISDLVGSNVKINFAGTPPISELVHSSVFYSAPGSSTKGLTGYYFNNQTLTDPVTIQRIDSVTDFHWSGNTDIIPGIPGVHFSIRWTGVIRPSSSGNYVFYVAGDDGFRLWVNNQLIIDNWVDEAVTTKTGSINLATGVEYPVKLEYYQDAGLADISFGYISDAEMNTKIIDAVSNSDAAVVCTGFNSSTEGEGFDRPFNLDAGQDSLIRMVASANPKTVVVMNAGGNVNMENWLDKIKGLLYAWYPGQNGGKAIAEVLFGKTCPSGKLPATFEKAWADNPVFGNYYENNGANHVKYNEGVFMGYRYYDANHIEPQFPFGYGLSYTKFSYSNLSVTNDNEDSVVVSFDIKNTGSVAGAEVAELYLNQNMPKVPRPVKELKEFAKVFLQPDETQTVTLKLGADAFSYYSTNRNSFVVDSGKYDIIIGASSADERLRQTFFFEKNLIIGIEKFQATPENEVIIYPVPSDNHITIQVNTNDLKSRELEVYNSAGLIKDKIRFSGSTLNYDCLHLPDGFYICRIITGDHFATGKFIVGHK
jgi:beta-glucosidase